MSFILVRSVQRNGQLTRTVWGTGSRGPGVQDVFVPLAIRTIGNQGLTDSGKENSCPAMKVSWFDDLLHSLVGGCHLIMAASSEFKMHGMNLSGCILLDYLRNLYLSITSSYRWAAAECE